MRITKIAILTILTGIMFTACSSDHDDDIIQIPRGDYENGILISHEGNFGQGNASVSFISDDFSTSEHGVFNAVNSGILGDTAQSIAFNNEFAYIILNGSNKIEVVNRYTFVFVATINSGLSNPRFMTFSNGKGYITNWGDASNPDDDYLAILDLTNNTINSITIPVVEGPEEIIANGNTIYVAHQGGYSQNDKVSVIDATSNSLSTTIIVGDVPNSLQFDASGNLWVLSGGKPSWTGTETAGKLSKINTSDNTVTSIDFGSIEHPNYLSIDNGSLYYYLNGSVYKMASSDTGLPITSELSGLSFYNMTTNNGKLYGVDAVDFTSNGILTVYDLSTNTEENTTSVGIIPNGIYFN